MSDSFHYFVSSVARWAVGTDREKLELLFKRDGLTYHVWKVPVPLYARYEISHFCPLVEGAVFLGEVQP